MAAFMVAVPAAALAAGCGDDEEKPYECSRIEITTTGDFAYQFSTQVDSNEEAIEQEDAELTGVLYDFGDGSEPIEAEAQEVVFHTYSAWRPYTVSVTVLVTAGGQPADHLSDICERRLPRARR